jgi:uncharacterized membrane protein
LTSIFYSCPEIFSKTKILIFFNAKQILKSLISVLLLFLSVQVSSFEEKEIDYDKLYFKNKCDQDIRVVIHYSDLTEKWVSKGWYKIEPDQKVLLARTRNTIFYFHAKTDDEKKKWSGEVTHEFKGKSIGHLKKKIKTETWEKWTQSLTCDEPI